MNIAHFLPRRYLTYRYFLLYLTFHHLQFKLASSRWLCRMPNCPKQKVTFVCSFGFSRKKDHTPRQPCCYYGRILLLGRRNALGTFVMEGDAVGGGETPRLWGVNE